MHQNPVKEAKGEYGKDCNRTACPEVRAIYYNVGTRAYYCRGCALDIQRSANHDNLIIFPKLTMNWNVKEMNEYLKTTSHKTSVTGRYTNTQLDLSRLHPAMALCPEGKPSVILAAQERKEPEHAEAVVELTTVQPSRLDDLMVAVLQQQVARDFGDDLTPEHVAAIREKAELAKQCLTELREALYSDVANEVEEV